MMWPRLRPGAKRGSYASCPKHLLRPCGPSRRLWTYGRDRGPHCEAGVINEHVDPAPIGRQAAGQRGDSFVVRDVKRQWKDAFADFIAELLQAIGSPRGGDNAMPIADETASHRGAETSCGAGH